MRKISFTGSYEVGERICKAAGMKKVTMELGSNSPVIVMDDADLDKAAEAITSAGFANAGQVCISAQRILTSQKVQRLAHRRAQTPRGGDSPSAIRLPKGRKWDRSSARRTPCGSPRGSKRRSPAGQSWSPAASGEGALHQATILDDVDPEMRVSREELFGPAVAITRFHDIDEAIRLANDTRFGLSAAIFTQDIDRAMKFAKEVESGNLHVNWSRNGGPT